MSLLHKHRTSVVLMGLIILVGFALFVGLRKTITLSTDGTSQSFSTYAFRVSDLLRLKHVSVSPSDRLSPPQQAWLKNRQAITLVRAIPVQILADGVLFSFNSPDRTVSVLLKNAGVDIRPGDKVLSNGQPVQPSLDFPVDALSVSLQVLRSVSFTINVDGSAHTITTTTPILGTALWGAGYTLFASDQLIPPVGTPITSGMHVTLTHANLVTIHSVNGNILIRTAATTVAGALQAAHLTPQGLDYSLPAPDALIPPDRKIRLVRVIEQVMVEQTTLSFKTEYQPDSSINLDSQSVLQAGEVGLTAQRVRIRYEDGVEVSQQVDSEWVARQPQPRIIGYGTNLVMHTTSVDGVTIQYWRSLSMYATSYHPSEGGDTTASGLPLKKGVAAVDTSLVPFFTQMYVPGYGEVTAADIGGGVNGRWLDLGYSDSDYVPWHQWVTVYFLWPPPDNIVWVVP